MAAMLMATNGHQLLAGAGLARDHDGQIRLHQARQHPINLLHRRGTADQRDGFEIVGLDWLTRPFFRLRQGAADDGDQFLEIERLRQIFVGAAFRSPNGGHERVLCAHDDDRQIRSRLLDPEQQIEGVLVRQHHVRNNQVAIALADPAPEGRRVAG
jgi:hypothetical protein